MTDPVFGEPKLVDVAEQPLAVIREEVAFGELPTLFDRAFPLIFEAIGTAGAQVVGPPLGVTHGVPGDTIDMSVAVPVAESFTADGEVVPATLPAGRAVQLLVRGDYGLLSAAYSHICDWIEEAGLTRIGLSWEQYLTEPEPGGDPALNETLLSMGVE